MLYPCDNETRNSPAATEGGKAARGGPRRGVNWECAVVRSAADNGDTAFRCLEKGVCVCPARKQLFEGLTWFGCWKRFPGRSGHSLGNGIGGKRIWDPGVEEA